MITASLLDKAFTQADYAINITDTAGVLQKVNQAYLNLYKFPTEREILGRTQHIIRSPRTSNSVYAAMWSTISAGTTWRGNLTNIARDGSEVFVHLTISPIRENGSIIGYMGFSLDRSQQVLLERELFHANKLVVLGTLCASLAHELNNPLASILLDAEYLENLTARPDAPIDWNAAHSASQSVIHGVERMKQVLEHLLMYSRKDPSERSTLSLKELIENSFLFLDKQLRNRGIDIEIDVPEDLLIAGNRTQLESVIHNLVGNSKDAYETRPVLGGNGKVPGKQVRIRAEKEPDGFVLLEYLDNAGGIPKELLDRIFEPFFTTKGEKEGTGLGLAISRKIIMEHGGIIDCESQGNTTRFSIRLPHC